jgi:hypothetical protein
MVLYASDTNQFVFPSAAKICRPWSPLLARVKSGKVRPQVQRHTVSRDRFTLRTSGDAPSQYCRNVKDTQSFSSHYCLS